MVGIKIIEAETEQSEQPNTMSDEDVLEFERMRKAWYMSEPVQFEIIKSLMYRETCFINTITKSFAVRFIKANAIKYLMKNFDRYDFFSNTYNLYGSLATFPNMPMFSFNIADKQREQKDFNDNFLTYMTGYDFLMDIDSENIETAYNQTYQIKKIFDQYKIIYSLKFSGKKGFHFEIRYTDLPMELKSLSFKQLEKVYKTFAERFAVFNNFFTIDYSIFDLRRICKTPYSVVYPYYFIALPLSDDEFEHFNLEYVSLPKWFNQIEKVKMRGVMKRDGDKDAFLKLIKDYTTELSWGELIGVSE